MNSDIEKRSLGKLRFKGGELLITDRHLFGRIAIPCVDAVNYVKKRLAKKIKGGEMVIINYSNATYSARLPEEKSGISIVKGRVKEYGIFSK